MIFWEIRETLTFFNIDRHNANLFIKKKVTELMRIYKRQFKYKSIWYIDYTDNNGKRVRRAIGTRKEAELVLANIRMKKFQGQKVPGLKKAVDLDQFWGKYKNYSSKVHSKETYDKDLSRIKPLIRYLKENKVNNLIDISPRIIQEFQSQYLAKHSRKSWNNILGNLKTALNKAVDWELIDHNPIAKIKPLKTDKYEKFFTVDEINLMIENAHDVLKSAIIILVNTGMRRAELLNLKWADVHLKSRKIIIRSGNGFSTKSRETRSVPISDTLYKHLVKIKKTSNNIYVWRPEEYNVNSITRAFWRLMKKLKMKGRLHDLRHTFASHLAMSGVPIPVIGELLGHKNISTTMRYSHLSPDTHKAAIKKLPF